MKYLPKRSKTKASLNPDTRFEAPPLWDIDNMYSYEDLAAMAEIRRNDERALNLFTFGIVGAFAATFVGGFFFSSLLADWGPMRSIITLVNSLPAYFGLLVPVAIGLPFFLALYAIPLALANRAHARSEEIAQRARGALYEARWVKFFDDLPVTFSDEQRQALFTYRSATVDGRTWLVLPEYLPSGRSLGSVLL